MMKGYKMVKEDYTDFRTGTVKYEIDTEMVHPNPDLSNESCAEGYHVSKETHNPLNYNARYPWRLLEVSYLKKDVIHDNGDKVRVSKLKVVKELEPWDIDLPNAKRVYGIIKRTEGLKFKRRTKQAEKDIRMLVKRHVDLLNKRHTGKSLVVLNGVKFHSIKQWGSVRDPVRGSVWDSVWCSVVMVNAKNPFLPLLEIIEKGAVFYGIDNEGYAHIIMPSAKEVKEDGVN